MPENRTIERASKDKRECKAPSTQAGEFVHEEMDHIRQGKHGARSTKQAIAIGLNKARRAGIDLQPPTTDSLAPKGKRGSQAGAKSKTRTTTARATKQKTGAKTAQRASRTRQSAKSESPQKQQRAAGKTTSARRSKATS